MADVTSGVLLVDTLLERGRGYQHTKSSRDKIVPDCRLAIQTRRGSGD